ncbi:MAG: 30S ribosomal protein S8 [bacterium]|nr:30S ribosomal protein S8 [bacterium]
MAVTDTIADMFTRIRNGLQARHDEVVMPFSKSKVAISEILKAEGFIHSFEILNQDAKKRAIRIELKYNEDGNPTITYIQRVSKPGKRLYAPKKRIPKVLNGFGISIVSTNKGIMTGRDARVQNVGGELIGEVY